MKPSLPVLAILLVTYGCGEDASDVLGRSYFQFAGGAEQQARDLSNVQFRAYVHQHGSSFLIYPAVSGTPSGTFVVPGVQEGTLLLQALDEEQRISWSEHESHELEFVTAVIGRPGLVTPELTTPLSIRADGLDAWSSGDELYLDCWNNGTETSGLQVRLAPSPVVGAASLDGDFDWSSPFAYSFGPSGRPYLMSMEAGDQLTISRMRAEQVGAIAVKSLSQVATGPAPTQTDGQSSSFTATFETPAQSQTLHASAELPVLRQQLGDAPTATWSLTVMRGPAAGLGLRMGPPLLQLSGAGLDERLDVSHSYADPFDPTWDLIVRFYAQQMGSLQFPGSANVMLPASITVRKPLTSAEQTIESPVGLLDELLLNGTRVADTAVIPWNGSSALTFEAHVPPNVVGFEVSLLKPSELELTEVVHISSLHDRITIPADGLVVGQPYVVVGTLYYNDGTTVAASHAVWGPVTLASP